ncbi:lytic transglycosylase domain-containing protein [Megalodesulfovibrio gigas]|nr:lytic transglycosylase domain-containing protein [Megalodesulfovibrio gigas]
MSGDAILAILDAAAGEFGLPSNVVVAVAKVESGLNSYAIRFEPQYRWLVDARDLRPLSTPGASPPQSFPSLRGCSGLTEWAAQKTSWGLMQVMGAVARERGFQGVFLSELCVPAVGAHYGCKHLRHLHARFFDRHGWAGVLAAYNAGSPTADAGRAYARKVQERMQ